MSIMSSFRIGQAFRCSALSSSIPTTSGTRPHQIRHFASSAALRASSSQIDHYRVLGVDRHASKKDIKEKFYELSKKYHPDAPSTSTGESQESRTARFQSISQSYAVLSDDDKRRSYDFDLRGGSGGRGNWGTTSPSQRRPAYASSQGASGFGGGSASAWSSTMNSERRQSANYAWNHPSNRKKGGAGAASAAQEAAGARADPFRTEERDAFFGDDHYSRFAAREARARSRAAQKLGMGGTRKSHFSSGTESFGAKAEEESRLINDSSFLRSGQVFLIFGACFVLAFAFAPSRSHNKDKATKR
ncbi:DnaJ-domain-containing protein [Meredithblackwellia eburnea MCA 4105]